MKSDKATPRQQLSTPKLNSFGWKFNEENFASIDPYGRVGIPDSEPAALRTARALPCSQRLE
jgi:hypothetical protein